MQRLSLNTGAFTVRNLEVMKAFCAETLRLPLLLSSATVALFELGTDSRGNTQVLQLMQGDDTLPLQRLALEANDKEFTTICRHLLEHGAQLLQSENSSAPGCAWRILNCDAPEGHCIAILNIDPSRCSPVLHRHAETGY